MLTAKDVGNNLERALRNMDDFSAGQAPVQRAAKKIANALDDLGIPYVIVGGLAVAAHGLERLTVDVDIILSREGLDKFKKRWLGVGWVERFAGSKGLRDVEFKLKVDILTPDEKPGDGKSTPFNFPDPAGVPLANVEGIWAGLRVIDLAPLIELKLASWMTAPHRGRDQDDVIRLIKTRHLKRSFGQGLHPYVRDKYEELWQLAQVKDPYEDD